MVKTSFVKSTIEIWSEDYINKESWMAIDEKDKDAEIVQIEHAYEDKYMVEVVRKEDQIIADNMVIRDPGYLENIMLCKESKDERNKV